MTQEIIEITKRSGLGMLLEIGGMDKCLEHFAKLVAEREREACAKLIESHGQTLANGLMLTEAIRARGRA